MSDSLNRVFATWSPAALCHVALLDPRLAHSAVVHEQLLVDFGFDPVHHPKEVFYL